MDDVKSFKCIFKFSKFELELLIYFDSNGLCYEHEAYIFSSASRKAAELI